MDNDTKPVVAGIGELLWDLFPTGRQPGGAPANFSFHAGQLGADAYPVSRVGTDRAGADLLDYLDSRELDTTLIMLDSRYPTGTVTVELDHDGVPTFNIHEDVAWDYLAAEETMDAFARRCDAVCFGTLASRSPVSRETIRRFLDKTPQNCLRVFDINIRQHFYTEDLISTLLDAATVLKLNDGELPLLADMFAIRGTDRQIAETLGGRFALDLVALTRGGKGSLLVGPVGLDEHPGVPAHIADTVGAGDAFTAALAIGLLRGKPLDAINDAANRVAAFVCGHDGGMPVLPDELRVLFTES